MQPRGFVATNRSIFAPVGRKKEEKGQIPILIFYFAFNFRAPIQVLQMALTRGAHPPRYLHQALQHEPAVAATALPKANTKENSLLSQLLWAHQSSRERLLHPWDAVGAHIRAGGVRER